MGWGHRAVIFSTVGAPVPKSGSQRQNEFSAVSPWRSAISCVRPKAKTLAEYLAGGSHPPVGLWFARRTGGLYGNPVEVMTVDVPLPAFLMRERVFTVDNSIDDDLLTMSVFVLSVERVV